MRRARRCFWTLLVIAALATGALSTALTARPSPAAAVAVAVSGVILAASGALAVRILVRLEPVQEKNFHARGGDVDAATRRCK